MAITSRVQWAFSNVFNMSVEEEVKVLAAGAAHLKTSGRFGHNPAESDIHRQLEAIWDALLIIARKIDPAA